MINDKIFFDEKDPTGINYDTPFTVYGSFNGRLWSKTPEGTVKFYVQDDKKGKVLQVVYAETSTLFSTSSTSFQDIGLSGSITPKSISSIIYVEVNLALQVERDTFTAEGEFNIVKNSTQMGNAERIQSQANGSTFIVYHGIFPSLRRDIHETESEITYKSQIRQSGGGGAVIAQRGSARTSTMKITEIESE